MDPSDSAWWWDHGLDGLIGAVIGGAVTAAAVIATLRHERRQVDLQEARTVASRLYAVMWEISWAIGENKQASQETKRRLLVESFELMARTRTRWPAFAVTFQERQTAFTTIWPLGPSGDALRRWQTAVAFWLEDPDRFERAGVLRTWLELLRTRRRKRRVERRLSYWRDGSTDIRSSSPWNPQPDDLSITPPPPPPPPATASEPIEET